MRGSLPFVVCAVVTMAAAFAAGLGCSDDIKPVSADGGDAAAEAAPADTSPGDASSPETASLAAFGATCTANDQCASGLCATFGDDTQHCSVTCADATTCPEGSQGRKCNGKGVCAH